MSTRERIDWEPLEDIVSKEVFKAEVAAWAKRIGVRPKEIHVRHEPQVGELLDGRARDVRCGVAAPAGRFPPAGDRP